MKKTDVIISFNFVNGLRAEPINVTINCPYCKANDIIKYNPFTRIYGECWNAWTNKVYTCNSCNKHIKIRSWDCDYSNGNKKWRKKLRLPMTSFSVLLVMRNSNIMLRNALSAIQNYVGQS